MGGFLGRVFSRFVPPNEPQPTFSVELPEGWVGAPLTKEGRAGLRNLVASEWPRLAELLEAPQYEMPPGMAGVVFMAVDLNSSAEYGKPTLLTVAEYDAFDLECEMRNVRANLLDQSDEPPPLDYRDLPSGRAGRIVRRWHVPSHQPEDVVMWGSGVFVTYRIHVGGTSYELQFETPSFGSDLWVPVFEEVTQSFRQVTDNRSALAAGVLPHEAPDLEALVPSEVFGRPICTYSVRPGHGREDMPPLESDVEVASQLGVRVQDVALAGSIVADPEFEVPYHFTVVRYRGAREEDLVAKLGPQGDEGWALVGERDVRGRHLFLVSDEAMPDMPGGRTHLFFVDDTRWFVSTGLDPWLEDFVEGLGAPQPERSVPATTQGPPIPRGQADASGWTVYLGDAVHRVELGSDTALHGRPTSFSCDGVVHRLKLPALWYGTPPVILPFSIDGAAASMKVSVARLSLMGRLKRVHRVFLGGGLGDVWNFELVVGEHPIGTISREPGARSS
jgi:hypothetical protein